MNREVWVLSDRDEGIMGVYQHQLDAVMHLQDVAPGAPLINERADGALCDYATRYRLERCELQ